MQDLNNLPPLAIQWIQQYDLKKHIEGGYFRETLVDPSLNACEDKSYRALYTSILFMLHGNEVSHFHQLKSDELWYFHQGDPLDIVCILKDGSLKVHHLGIQVDQVLQVMVEKGTIFGSFVPSGGVSLVACAVIPGFMYTEFKLFSKEELLAKYPQHHHYINLLGG